MIEHVTLNRGHYRASPRSEVDDAALAVVAELLARGLDGQRPVLPAVEPSCSLRVSAAGSVMLATVETAPAVALGIPAVPIVTIGVAADPSSPDGRELWRRLHDTPMDLRTQAGRPPHGRWCAVRIEPGAGLLSDPAAVLPVLADFERVLAWAWVARASGG